MTSLIDVRTLSVVIGAALFSLGLSMLYYSSNTKTYPGFGKWTLGNIFNGMRFILIGCRHFLPVFFTIFIANAFIYSGLAMVYMGFNSFANKNANTYANIAAVLMFSLILHPYFTYFSPNADARIILSSFAAAMYFLLCVMVLVRDVRFVLGRLNTMLLVTLILMVVLFISRGIYPLMSQVMLSDYLTGGIFYEFILLFIIILAILFVVGLMQPNSQMLEKEFQNGHEQLEDSESRYKSLVEQSLQGLAIVQDNSYIKDFTHPEDWDVFNQILKS